MSKNVPKCPNVFWGDFFENIFLPSVPWSHRKFSKKSKKIQKCKNAQNRSKIVQTSFEHVLWHFFWKKERPVFHGGSGLRKFSKNSEIIKIPKKPKIVSKSVHTCFEHALRRFFRISLPSVPCRAFQIFWT